MLKNNSLKKSRNKVIFIQKEESPKDVGIFAEPNLQMTSILPIKFLFSWILFS